MAKAWGERLRDHARACKERALRFRPALNPLLRMLAVMGAATLFSLLMHSLFEENGNVSVVYTLAVMVVACVTPGYFYGTVASVIGVLGVNYFFMWPYLAFNFTRTGYPFTFALLFLTSIITSTLMASYRNQAARARENERRTDALYRMTNELLAADGDAKAGSIVAQWISRISGFPAHYQETPAPGAGFALPVETQGRPGGAFVVEDGGKLAENGEMKNFLRLFAAQYAMVAERQRMRAERNRVALEMEAERLRSNLLRAISHDLRTPLTSISGAASVLLEAEAALPPEGRRQLYTDIRDNVQWLIRMVENLLSATRITGGPAAIHKAPEMAEEVLAEAAGQIRRRFPGQALRVKAPAELLIVPMDFTLIEQVLINLMENAVYHGGDGGPIEVEAAPGPGQTAVFTVRDHGRGVDEARMERLFNGYINREEPSGDSHRGMGLGLSICASIVRAHGGRISAANAEAGGAVFRFCLPLEGTPQGAAAPLQ